MKKSLLITICALAFSGVSAQAQTAGLLDGWVGEGSLTGSRTTGNTETTDIGIGVKLDKETDTWSHHLNGSWDRGSVEGEETRRRLDLGYQIDRTLTERIYLYGNADYYTDDFGAFQDGFFVGAGAGYKVLKDQPFLWDIESGVGFRNQQVQNDGPSDSEVAVRGFSDIDYQINDFVSLFNDTEVIWASSDTYIWNEVGITAKLVDNLAAKVSYRIDHHTDVAPGLENTDTITRFGIVYTIK